MSSFLRPWAEISTAGTVRHCVRRCRESFPRVPAGSGTPSFDLCSRDCTSGSPGTSTGSSGLIGGCRMQIVDHLVQVALKITLGPETLWIDGKKKCPMLSLLSKRPLGSSIAANEPPTSVLPRICTIIPTHIPCGFASLPCRQAGSVRPYPYARHIGAQLEHRRSACRFHPEPIPLAAASLGMRKA